MRIYLELNSSFYLLENVDEFSLNPAGGRFYISFDSLAFVGGLDEAAAVRAMEELLSLTADSDNRGVAVISWNGEHFTRRILYG